MLNKSENECVSFAPLEKGASRRQTPKPKCSAGTRRVAGAGRLQRPALAGKCI